MLSAPTEGRRGHHSGAPPAACLRWQKWAVEQRLVRGLGREMDTGEEGCMAMTFQPGAGQPISWAADSRVQQALPMCVLGWDWARVRETVVRHLEFSGKRAKLVTWHEDFGVSLGTYCWLSIKHSLTTEKEGKAWRFSVLVGFVYGLFSLTTGKYYLYGGCLRNILGEINRSSFSYLSISLDCFQMNTTGLKDQIRPWLILCQYHLHKSPGGGHPFPPPEDLSSSLQKQPFWCSSGFVFLFDDGLVVWPDSAPWKTPFASVGRKQETVFYMLPSRAWPYPSHITGFWYPWSPGALLAGWDALWCAGGRIGPLKQKSLLFYYYHHEVAKRNSLNVLFDEKRALKTATW